MSDSENGLSLASPDDVKSELKRLKKIDKSNMLDCVIEIPDQIISAVEASVEFDEGDIPLNRNQIHLLGLGGSAIAGDLLLDMLETRRLITLHRGRKPQRDKGALIVSSYSGNTKEILDIAPLTPGGLRTVIFMTSGGRLAEIAHELSIPVWSIPENYQPRASIGWSLGLVLELMERWRVVTGKQKMFVRAAKRLKASLSSGDFNEHVLVRAALSIARVLKNRFTVVFHTNMCTGAGKRLASQICENTKQPAFSAVIPEALHNTVEGFTNGNPSNWNLVFMSDHTDIPSLRDSIQDAMNYLTDKGFNCTAFPAAGDDAFEHTLSRLFVADMVSLFMAVKRKVDPTPLSVISELKSMMEVETDKVVEDDDNEEERKEQVEE